MAISDQAIPNHAYANPSLLAGADLTFSTAAIAVSTFDLTGCDREAIHIPNAIQPHGVMLVVDRDTLNIVYAAGDIADALGIDQWLGLHVSALLGPQITSDATAAILTMSQRAYVGTIQGFNSRNVDVTAHLASAHLVFELERREQPIVAASNILSAIEIASMSFDEARTLGDLCTIAAREFRKLTGYDRVMVYRFMDDGAGVVEAENRRPDIRSFLNHRFPASDIPKQARELYIRNPLRVIPNIDYIPAPLRPEWRVAESLDMSDSILRSVSPIHLAYLRNMGVAASASVSIVKDGVLWGLIACHNETPRQIFYDVRAACRTLASSLSRQIRVREEAGHLREQLRLRSVADELVSILECDASPVEDLPKHFSDLITWLQGDGLAIVQGDNVKTFGKSPPAQFIKDLARYLSVRTADAVYVTQELGSVDPNAIQFAHVAAGVLTISVSAPEPWTLFWFRAEDIEVVNWAGNPPKYTDLKPGESLSPRASFDAWEETAHGRSRPWSMAEVEVADRFRRDLATMYSNRSVRNLNKQLLETVAEKNTLLEQNKFLIGEVNHRVQNSLQLVSSFLTFQAKENSDPLFSEAVIEATRRIGAVSLLHRSLYRGDEIGVTDVGRYIGELADHLIGSMGAEWRRHFELDLKPVLIPIDRVIPLGLIVTELVININKYAYGGLAGPVLISVRQDGQRLHVSVADTGRGRVSDRPGFGTRMMNALVSQLSGELTFIDAKPGLCVTLVLSI